MYQGTKSVCSAVLQKGIGPIRIFFAEMGLQTSVIQNRGSNYNLVPVQTIN